MLAGTAKKMQVLIVEDRPLARAELNYLLSLHPDLEVYAECEDTASAWPIIADGKVDGIFLDIDIESESHCAGLDLAIRIDRAGMSVPPWIVFITGFESFALTAHQVRPFGYLVKPLNDAELTQVLDKVRKTRQHAHHAQRTIRIKHKKIIRGEISGCIKYITPEEILYIQAEKNTDTVKIKLHHGETLEGVSVPLRTWQANLHGDLLQIHRSHLVNIHLINGLNPDPFRVDGFNVTFKGVDDELAVGRTHLQGVMDFLDGGN